MTLRRTTAAALAVLAVAASGCDRARQVSDVPDDDRPTPDETPIIEPVSPPAQDLERPEESGPEDDEDVTDFDS